MVLSQDEVLQRFVERIVDDSCWAWTAFNKLRGAGPRGAPRWKSDAGLVALFSDEIKFLAQFSPGNMDIISTSSCL